MALPKKHRLTIDKKILWRLKKEGKTIQTPLLSAKYYLRKEGKEIRVSVVIGTAVDKRATTRNRIKRAIYEAIWTSLPKLTGIDMIIYPKKSILEKDKEDIKTEVALLLEKLKIE